MDDHDGWIDARWNFGQSGEVSRSGFDVGAGLALAIARGFRVGPVVRWQWSSGPDGAHPHWLEIGLTVGLLGDPRAARPSTDADDDGVPNAEDACPTEPAGAHPDPARRGCSLRDQDGDGVFDAADVCPIQPAGARPDPGRAGCPLGDQDGDGLGDAEDVCPTVAAGATPDPARRGCPTIDSDGDGVSDAEDPCPSQPPGARPDPGRRGCPVVDADGDTVPDAVDRCPTEAGAPSRDAARNGCPGLVRVDEQQIHILRPVYFATNRDTILEESFPVLTAVADAVLAGDFARIRIEGHTDDRGPDARNLDLSRRRAESVRAWLIAHEVAADRLEAVGLGETRPIEPNDTELGRAGNRRVEFHIVAAAE
jgi:outer membrane protein OmpA-like peptidoglycan-associated protein